MTVLADATGAAQRVTIRDPFPRGLHGLVGNGISGGDDVPTHANNWAQTPTIISAYTYDDFATVQVHGVANPLSLVDIYFDYQITVARQPPVMADATGAFSFSGPLPGRYVQVIAVSTLNDPAHPGWVGSSSRFSAPKPVTASAPTTSLQLSPATLIFTAAAGDPASLAQTLIVTAPTFTPTLSWQTSVTTTDGMNWLSATPVTGSGNGILSVMVNHLGLAPNTYHGSVTVADVSSRPITPQ